MPSRALRAQADASLAFDWDDVEGNTRRRLAGLQHEQLRQDQMKRLRRETKGGSALSAGDVALRRMGMKKH
jgi:hypothetical protein